MSDGAFAAERRRFAGRGVVPLMQPEPAHVGRQRAPFPRLACGFTVRIAATAVACWFAGTVAAHATLPEILAATQVLRAAGVSDAYVVEVRPASPGDAAEKAYRTVFDLGGTVWSYSAEAGTTMLGASPSPDGGYRDALVARQAALVPPGTSLRLYPQAVSLPSAELSQRSLGNACVISCVLSLALRARQTGIPAEAGLVLFRLEAPARLERTDVVAVDHAVLALKHDGRWYCIDPRQPGELQALDHLAVGEGIDPVLFGLAQQLGRPLQRALYFPFSPATLAQLAGQSDVAATR